MGSRSERLKGSRRGNRLPIDLIVFTLCFSWSGRPAAQADFAPGGGNGAAAAAEQASSPTKSESAEGQRSAVPTPTPIALEEFRKRLAEWVYRGFAQIGSYREGTLENTVTGESWRVEEGDRVAEIEVIGISGDRMQVRIGGREGILPLVRGGEVLVILEDGTTQEAWSAETGPPLVVRGSGFQGRAHFRSTGNNRFSAPQDTVWRVGYGAGEYTRLNLAIKLGGPASDILIQARGERRDWVRWGFDAEQEYKGGFPWPPRGTTTGLEPEQWHYVSIHLVADLGFAEGDRLVELAFSAAGKDALFDSVSLSQGMPEGARGVESPQ